MADPASKDGAKDGDYVVVARRYRPRGFDELVGQDHVGRALKNAIETNRVGHAYLFTGARGVGKTSSARIFAKALNNPAGPTATPDNASDVAQAIDSGEDVDVIEIDGASNRGIDEIRSLRANVGVRPSRSRYKIYIIDEVHMLTGAAFNALLKTLEEPPEHVKFIFCTTDPEKLPITVLSRCQRFDFAPVEVSKIIGRLREICTAEGAVADDAALELIARRAAGSMRDSQSLLEQVLAFSDGSLDADQVHAMLGTADDIRLHALAGAMANRDAAQAMQQLDAAIDAGVDAGRLAEQLLGYFRDLMAVTVGCDPSLMRHTSASLHDELKQLGDAWGLQTVLAVVGLIDQTLVRIRMSVYSRVLLEATLIQICNLPDLQNIANLAAASASAARAAGSPSPAGEKKKLALSPRPPKPTAPAATAPPPSSPTPTAAQPETAGTQPPAAPEPSASEPASVATATLAKPTGQAMLLSAANANEIWLAAIERIEEVRQSLARQVDHAEYLGPGKLRLVFPGEAGLTMRRLDAPENRSALVDAVSEVIGEKAFLEFHAAPLKPRVAKVETSAPKQTRMQRMREIESNPLIRACVDAFGAEIVRVDRPK
ncbi:DNA polymerase III subunit gamma/tau [Rubripirellula reticaptiva]|uniref:DNA polymerase III subunit gamma/tau n=1 Tax=Rubripirellula reticaptiva TaxID=2528013 RepID=A0A5C6F3K9_9BACT|nr:DNA polymerase III subunit gamma/tau [Rubripirellula reticaptiva]TWU55090.1 DNA polymerase III subunit tau [Rubripirellula reticaptiva]